MADEPPSLPFLSGPSVKLPPPSSAVPGQALGPVAGLGTQTLGSVRQVSACALPSGGGSSEGSRARAAAPSPAAGPDGARLCVSAEQQPRRVRSGRRSSTGPGPAAAASTAPQLVAARPPCSSASSITLPSGRAPRAGRGAGTLRAGRGPCWFVSALIGRGERQPTQKTLSSQKGVVGEESETGGISPPWSSRDRLDGGKVNLPI